MTDAQFLGRGINLRRLLKESFLQPFIDDMAILIVVIPKNGLPNHQAEQECATHYQQEDVPHRVFQQTRAYNADFHCQIINSVAALDGFLKPLDYFCNGNILAGRRRARHQLQPPFCRFLAHVNPVGYSDQVRIFKFDPSPLIPVI